jgi:hypothetical protein
MMLICLISSLRRVASTDPAPFYLFDEIDAALDPKYRAAVAGMNLALVGSAPIMRYKQSSHYSRHVSMGACSSDRQQ